MSEHSTVQNPMLHYADSIGWTYISPDETLKLRNGDTVTSDRSCITGQAKSA